MMRLMSPGEISKTSVSPRATALIRAGRPVTRLTSPPNSCRSCKATRLVSPLECSTISTAPRSTTKNLYSRSPALNRCSPSCNDRRVPNLASVATWMLPSVGNAILCMSRSAIAHPFSGQRASLPQGLRDPRRHVEFHLIDVTPGPPLAALEGSHHRMGRVFEMFGGMAIGRAVATADMTTSQAETEMHPGRSKMQAFFTTYRASSHRLNSSHVWTGHESPPGHLQRTLARSNRDTQVSPYWAIF